MIVLEQIDVIIIGMNEYDNAEDPEKRQLIRLSNHPNHVTNVTRKVFMRAVPAHAAHMSTVHNADCSLPVT